MLWASREFLSPHYMVFVKTTGTHIVPKCISFFGNLQQINLIQYCNLYLSPSIIGTPFYLMDYVAGKIYKDPSLPGLDAESRKKVYTAMNKTIAKIHSVDVTEAGIADYGKHGEYEISFWYK